MRSEGRGAGTGTSEATDTAISPESREERKKKRETVLMSTQRHARSEAAGHNPWDLVRGTVLSCLGEGAFANIYTPRIMG